MASTIAAVTTGGGGVITTADSSGNLSLLSGATTVVAVTSTGVAVTGTLSSSGVTTLANGAILGTPASGNISACTSTSMTMVSPLLGTPTSGVLTHCTGTANSLNAGIGVNQTWQNVLASRAATTVYTNSSGKPIFVAAWCSNATGNMTLTVGSITVSFFDPDTANSLRMTVNGIVPDGSTYFVSLTTNTLSGWSELR